MDLVTNKFMSQVWLKLSHHKIWVKLSYFTTSFEF